MGRRAPRCVIVLSDSAGVKANGNIAKGMAGRQRGRGKISERSSNRRDRVQNIGIKSLHSDWQNGLFVKSAERRGGRPASL